MSFKHSFAAAIACVFLATSAIAGDASIMIDDPYARASTKMSTSGAAFMTVMNHGSEDDRLVSVRSEVADRTELHTHLEDANGVMKMVHVEEGFSIPAGGSHALARGGDHVMFMGLRQPFAQGDQIPVTLIFEKAGEITIDIPVDLERKPMHGGGHMKHGAQKTDG
ncbi:copper chaperone PCu(A)C [Primorskyibacter sp. S87]|uniref:copper chaperone PCu(A)C n=1 Tax=Primorskyibacter sp. S87 TaxID=3415126 RepID=UPI003C7ABD94